MDFVIHRDPVHGDVRFDAMAAALLDTSAMQRLGRVYQLGYAHLVYRGGTHTRLSHAMGAAHVAGRLVDLLRQNYADGAELPAGALEPGDFLPAGANAGATLDERWTVLRHIVLWAALLHDVGHVPLGHTLEDEFEGIYRKHDSLWSPRVAHLWHEESPGVASEMRATFARTPLPDVFARAGITTEEAWAATMLTCLYRDSRNGPAYSSFRTIVSRAVAGEEAKPEGASAFLAELIRLMDLVDGRLFAPYMADLVADTISADYLDYVRRDPQCVGLDVLRDDRVASRFFVGRRDGAPRTALSLVDRRGKPRLDTCTGIVELVRQRFRFAEVIYYHKTKVSASAMLAKVFALIGPPAEVAPARERLHIGELDAAADRIVLEGSSAALRSRCMPASLLDPEIGDESLLLWLQQHAWDGIERAARERDRPQVDAGLRAVALLQALTRRELYKVCAAFDARAFETIPARGGRSGDVESSIASALAKYRSSAENRHRVEHAMASAAGWPADALLLYVPPRKVQAKGIDTGALDGGTVVALGDHEAIRNEVRQLNEAYRNLWRILLFVHPSHAADALGLSKAVDVLVHDLWPDVDLQASAGELQQACWFPYIAPEWRPAAERYARMPGGDRPDWKQFARQALRSSRTTGP
ncbi:MAG: hypothetical protein AB7J63_19630, partial [Vicinamibacterales bacterium]